MLSHGQDSMMDGWRLSPHVEAGLSTGARSHPTNGTLKRGLYALAQASTIRMKARRVASPIEPPRYALRSAGDFSGESKWTFAAWRNRKVT